MNKKVTLLILALALALSAQAKGVIKIADGEVPAAIKTVLEANANKLLSDMEHACIMHLSKISIANNYMTKSAEEDLKQMWKSSAMRCPDGIISCRGMSTPNGGWQLRGIPVDLDEADEGEERQELTIGFLPDGRIDQVAIAIEMHRYDELMAEQESDLDYTRRQIIVNFIENFRTAYNRRDIGYLEQVYSDNALIITGKVVQEKQGYKDVSGSTLGGQRVAYVQQSKREYLTRLKAVFNRARYLNVKFEDIEIVQHPKYDGWYGVTLKQHWHTSGYSDEGYLFLMVDFRDENLPLITVRTWQPHKDKYGNVVTTREDVFSLGDFKIERK